MIFERIAEEAVKLGLSIADVESAAGLGKNTIYNWKRTKPSAEMLASVAEILNVSVEYLLGRTNTRNHTSWRDDGVRIDASYGDVIEQLEILHKNPEMRVLLSSSAKLQKEDLDAVVAIVRRMNKERDFDE